MRSATAEVSPAHSTYTNTHTHTYTKIQINTHRHSALVNQLGRTGSGILRTVCNACAYRTTAAATTTTTKVTVIHHNIILYANTRASTRVDLVPPAGRCVHVDVMTMCVCVCCT